MNFMEAVEQMKQGKKVRIENYEHMALHIYKDKICYGNEHFLAEVSITHILSTDWEVVEEPKKSLWDKSFLLSERLKTQYDDEGNRFYSKDVVVCSIDDVKEALRQLKKSHYWTIDTWKNVEKIFGEELVGEK